MAQKVKKNVQKRGTVKPAKRTRVSKAKKKTIQWKFPLNRKNFMAFAVGLGVILLGFILMSTGITEEAATPDGTWNNVFAVSIAPILLVIGYCIIIPYAILKYYKTGEN